MRVDIEGSQPLIVTVTNKKKVKKNSSFCGVLDFSRAWTFVCS